MAKKGQQKDSKADKKKREKKVEDKTFGLKNKNKSKKVQNYIAQQTKQGMHQRGQKSEAQMRAESERKKAQKAAAKQAERDMFALLGADAKKLKDKSGGKSKKTKDSKAKEMRAEQKRLEAEQFKQDFAVPITTLDQIFRVDSKSVVPRVCATLVHKDTLPSRTSKNQPCLKVQLTDGTTRIPFTVYLVGWTPSTFHLKVDRVVDIRDSTAYVRGDKVELEIVKDQSTIRTANERVTEHVERLRTEREELRARGGLPIEEQIEEQRQALDKGALTPVTEKSFAEWKERKKQRLKAEAEKKVVDAKKKTGGKGLQVLSGKALFAYDATLFKDDENAMDDKGYEEEPEEEEEGTGAAKPDDLFAGDVPDDEDLDDLSD